MTKIDDFSILETKTGWRYTLAIPNGAPDSVSDFATRDEAVSAVAEAWAKLCAKSKGSVIAPAGGSPRTRADFLADALEYFRT